MSYRCCDCGEIKASKPEIESHINADHIGWTPYQCFYCNQNGITTRKPSKSMLRDHVTERHPGQQFTYLYTDDETKNELLKDMIIRSTLDQQPAQVNASPISLAVSNASSLSSSRSPFAISSFEPKDEVVDITNDSPKIKDIDIITIDDDDEDVQGNVEKPAETDSNQSSDSGNFSCQTCKQVIPRNLLSIRDHIKLHFKEKTGCFPVDLKKLPYTLQQIYYNLFVTSFPVEGASILRNDILPNLVQTTVRHIKKEPEPETVHHVAMSSASGGSPSHRCNKCGKEFAKLSSLSIHESRWCKKEEEMDHSAVTYDCNKCGKQFDKHTSLAGHQNRWCNNKAQKVVPKSNNCHLCGMRFASVRAFSFHKCSFTTKKRVLSTSYTCSECSKRFESKSGLNDHKCTPRKKTVTPKPEKTAPKIEKKTRKVEPPANASTVCHLCNVNFKSKLSLHVHHGLKHRSAFGRSHCKICKIDIAENVSRHILTVHMKKKTYECSICKSYVPPSVFEHHDLRYHKGLGKAHCIYNINQNRTKLEELRNELIIKVGDSKISTPQVSTALAKHQKLIVKFKPKSKKRPDLKNSKNESPSHSGTVKNPKLVTKMQKTKSTPGGSTVCDVCDKSFTSQKSMHLHRGLQHRYFNIKSYCKKCRIKVGATNSSIATHILNVHMKKMTYECSICKKTTFPGSIKQHDLAIHKGLGKARCIYNVDLYETEILKLQKKLMGKKLSASKLPSKNPGLKHERANSILSHKKSIIKKKLQPNICSQAVVKHPSRSMNDTLFPQDSENVAKCGMYTVQLKPSLEESMKNQMGTKCNLCRKSFPSSPQMYFHQREKHGLPVQWHCKECKINMRRQYITQHLLFVHLSKYQYQCSLCDDIGIFPANIALHDKTRHGGEGNAKIIKNSERYEQELKELHNKFIVEANSTSIAETEITTPEKINIVTPSINRQQLKTKFQPKSVNRSDNAKWLSRFKRSQRRKCLDSNRRVLKKVAFKKDFTRGVRCAATPTVTATPNVKSELTEELLNNGFACFPSASSSVTPSTVMTGSETDPTAIQPSLVTTVSETLSNATGTNSTELEILVSKTSTAEDKTEAASGESETTKLMAETVQVEMEIAPSEIITTTPITEPVQVESETAPAEIEATETAQVEIETASSEIITTIPLTEPVQVESETAQAEIEATEPATETAQVEMKTAPAEPEITVQTTKTVEVNSEAAPAEIEASEPTTETVYVESEPAPAEIVTAMLMTEPVQIEGETTQAEMEINEPTRETTQVEMKTSPAETEITVQRTETVQLESDPALDEIETMVPMTETVQFEMETAPAEIVMATPMAEPVQIERETTPAETEITVQRTETVQVNSGTAPAEIQRAMLMTETIQVERETAPAEIVSGTRTTEPVEIEKDTAAAEIETAVLMTETIQVESETTMPTVETAQAEMESGMLMTAQFQSEAAKPEPETFTSTIERVEAEEETTLAEAEVTMPRTEIPHAESETAVPITETVQVQLECGTAPTEIEASELMTEILQVESGTAAPTAETDQVESGTAEAEVTVPGAEITQVESETPVPTMEAMQVESKPALPELQTTMLMTPNEIETSELMTETIQVESRTAQAEIVETAVPMTETEQVKNETAAAETKATVPATETPSAEIETTILMTESVQVEMETDPVECETTIQTVETTPIEMETTRAEATVPTHETLQTEKETAVAEFETSMPMTDVIEAEMAKNLAATETVLELTEAVPTEMETAPAEPETITSTIDTTQTETEATVPTTETPQVGSETSSTEINILVIESVQVEMETDPVEPETTMQMVETSPIQMETTVAEAAVPTNETLQTEKETAAAEFETSMLVTDVKQAEIATNLPTTETVLESNEVVPTEMETAPVEHEPSSSTIETAEAQTEATVPTMERVHFEKETSPDEIETTVLLRTETTPIQMEAPQAEADTTEPALEAALPTNETAQMETETAPETFLTGWPF